MTEHNITIKLDVNGATATPVAVRPEVGEDVVDPELAGDGHPAELQPEALEEGDGGPAAVAWVPGLDGWLAGDGLSVAGQA